MTIKKYKRYIKIKSEITINDLYSLWWVNRLNKKKKKETVEKIDTFLKNKKIHEVNYYWTSRLWVYEFDDEEYIFRVKEDEFSKYFEIAENYIRKLKLEKLKSVQN